MKNKLLLLAAVLLTTLSVKAVDAIEEGVDYYIMNVETDLFLGAQNYWGTQGAISTDAGIFQFVPGTTGEGYNIMNTLISVTNKNLGTNLYTDNNGLATVQDDVDAGTTKSVDGIWTIENQGGGIFAFKCVSEWKWENDAWVEIPHGYLCKSETAGYRKGFELMFSEELTDNCLFRVLTYDEALEYMVDKAQSSNVSFNFLIKNPDFCRNNSTAAWTVSADCTNKNLAGGDNNNMCAESWRSTFTISQIVKNLPAGRYQLSAQGFYQRYEGEDEAPYVFAGDTKVALPVLNGPENSMTTASQAFTAGKYMIDPVRFNLTEKTDLEIGFHSGSKSFWCIWDNIQLMSYSNVKEYGDEILAGITYPYQPEALASTDVRNAYNQAYNDFAAFVAGITPGVTTFDDVDAEYAKFTAAEAALKASIETWSGYTVTAERAKSLYSQIFSQEGKYNPNAALNALGSYANGSSSAFGPGSSSFGYTFVNGCYEYIKENPSLNDEQLTQEVAFVTGLMNDAKKNSARPGMDVTFLLVNPDFRDATAGNGWQGVNTITAAKGGLSGWPTAEAYAKSNFDFYQIVEGAPAGLYKVTVNAFYRPDGASWTAEDPSTVVLYMGSIQNPVQNIAADAIKNDLIWDDDEQKYLDGEVAKNGTNCYFWDGLSAPTDADKEAIWKGNKNPDLEIQNLISSSTTLTNAGRYNSDAVYNESYLIPNGMDGASIAFSAGRYEKEVVGEVTDEGDGVGTLRIGLKTIAPMGGSGWCLWGGFKLVLAGEDPSTMKEQMKNKLNELNTLVPDVQSAPGICETLLFDTIDVAQNNYQALYDNPVLQSYQTYKDAYDDLVHIIGSTNKYLEAYNKFSADLTRLGNMISAFNPDTPTKEEYANFAQNVYTAYTDQASINTICLTPEDLENCKIYEDQLYGAEPEEITRENLADAVEAGQDGGYITTYSQFDAFFKECSQYLSTIYLTVDPSATAEAPQDLTEQLQNPDFKSSDQWWGTAWGAINNTAGEMYQNIFDTYQSVFMPAGYYTLQGFAMDRRGAWKDVLDNSSDYRFEDRTCLYAKVGDGDTIQTDVANAKFVAQTTDLTEGTGGISEYVSNETTWYAPNSMEQYRNWMDAKGDFNFGTELTFEVPVDAFASLGFFRRAQEGASWFIADEIKLFYAADASPVTGIVAPTSIEKYGKADGKYLEKGKIVIYNNGKKFNVAGQIVK